MSQSIPGNLRLLDRPTPAQRPWAEARLCYRAYGLRRRPALYISEGTGDRPFVARLAQGWGAQKVLVARRGRDGLHVAMDRRLSMVVVDAHLPDVQAATLVLAMKRLARSSHLPIVVLANDRSSRQRAQFLWAGANAYVTERSDGAEIEQTLGVLLDLTAQQ
jgi:CheY-like chemotaxis protein